MKDSRGSLEREGIGPPSLVFQTLPHPGNPILTVDEATVDEHDVDGLSSAVQTTLVKKPRPRFLSEQLLGRARPQAMHEEPGNFYLLLHIVRKKLTYIYLGVMSVLDTATNDLA